MRFGYPINTVKHIIPGSGTNLSGLPVFSPDSNKAYYIKRGSEGRAHREGDESAFTLGFGRTISFANDTHKTRGDEVEEQGIYYRYYGNLIGHPQWLTVKSYCESELFILVYQVNSHQTQVWNKLVPSPDGTHLAVRSMALDYASGLNGLQLLLFNQNKPQLQWKLVIGHWEPQRICWLNNQTIAIEEYRFNLKSGEYDKLTQRSSFTSEAIKKSRRITPLGLSVCSKTAGLVFSVAAFAHFAGVYRHRPVALRVAANFVDAFTDAVAIGSIAMGRYTGRIRALHLSTFSLGVGPWINGCFNVLGVGFLFR